jgi:hypothetical protein
LGTPDPLESIAETPQVSDEAIAEYLKSKGFVVTKQLPNERGVVADTTENVPTAPSNPFDLSKIPPPGERGSAPVQVPTKVWGNPRFANTASAPGPQPTKTPPRGR